MNCHFVVGQKVVAVRKNDLTKREIMMRDAASKAGVVFPKIGEVYTIRDVYIATRFGGEEVLSVRLMEVRNDPTMKYKTGVVAEIGFDASCFRPATPRHTDISIFTDMLIEHKHPVTA